MPNPLQNLNSSEKLASRYARVFGGSLILGGVFCAFLAANVGFLMLFIGLATMIQGLFLLTREGRVQSYILVSSAALVLQTIYLYFNFYWPFLIVFLLSSIGLYLSTEWPAITLGGGSSQKKQQEELQEDEADNDFESTVSANPDSNGEEVEAGLAVIPDDGIAAEEAFETANDRFFSEHPKFKKPFSTEDIAQQNEALMLEIKKLRLEVKSLRAESGSDENQRSSQDGWKQDKGWSLRKPRGKQGHGQGQGQGQTSKPGVRPSKNSTRPIDSVIGVFVVFTIIYIAVTILF